MSDIMPTLFNPGSPEAIEDGCICSPSDNRDGQGSYWGTDIFVYDMKCPYHGPVLEAMLEGMKEK